MEVMMSRYSLAFLCAVGAFSLALLIGALVTGTLHALSGGYGRPPFHPASAIIAMGAAYFGWRALLKAIPVNPADRHREPASATRAPTR
jgi:hypothetical protein